MFAMQPVYNAGRAAHALRSDQNTGFIWKHNIFPIHELTDCDINVTHSPLRSK